MILLRQIVSPKCYFVCQVYYGRIIPCLRSYSSMQPSSLSDSSSFDVVHQVKALPPNLRSCLKECTEPVTAKVVGQIPTWVKGYLLRNGPGLRKIGPDEYRHLFDGLALIHQFTIDNGYVTYRNKFLRSEAYKRNMKANRIVVSDFGTRAYPDPCKSLLGRYMSYFSFKQFTDNDSVSIYPVGDELYASTESTFLHKIDPKTIDTTGSIDLAQYVAVNTQTAHPHIESNGVVYNLGSNFSGKGSYNVIKVDPNASKGFTSTSLLTSIPVRNQMYPSYYHSFLVTEDFIIFIEQPLVTSIPSILLNHFTGGAYSAALKWRPEFKTRFNVIKKSNGEIIADNYVSEPFAFFHTINAYQEDGHIICDICCYQDGSIVNALFSDKLAQISNQAAESKAESVKEFQSLKSQARRYVLPLNIDSSNELLTNLNRLKGSSAKAIRNGNEIEVTHEPLTSTGSSMAEMPQINYRHYNGKNYQYFYSITRGKDFLTQLLKCNVKTKETVIWSDAGCTPSEPVFIPKPGAIDEDDGVILSAVLYENIENEGFLLALDGKSFKELARAHFKTPSAITSDFHGLFCPIESSDQLNK
ncbi:beta,beta-carotene 9',10'-oxygenase [Tetranychus urticae]|uniref:Uncharacterized protein n=1 Tax=Tetranychus urticae TaxID=32264 RepID=T1KM44_TETUR|nr:beta,beta-carotene 9',10'-oxygenase [Tetranychus urticae]